MVGLVVAVAVDLPGRATAPAGAAGSRTAQRGVDPGRVSIVTVEGLIDPVLARLIDRSITEGEQAGVLAVVIQLDSPGSVVSPERLAALARHVRQARVPVGVWVGPSGSRALGGAAQLAGSAELLGLAPGARIGKTGDLDFPELLAPRFRAAQPRLRDGTVNDNEARRLQIAPKRRAATILEFLGGIPGFKTEQVKGSDGRPVRQPLTRPVFSRLPVQDQLFHTVASPPAAYLLFLIGLALIVFELFTAGVGVAGLVGAGCFVLSCYGLAVLPVRPVALALLVLALFGFSVDVQTGVPRLWSAVAFVALVAGSVTLYDGLGVSWIALVVGIVGLSTAMVAGMPAMVRTRFSTPTIGREWMIGEEGEAVTKVDPDGVVRVRGALWRARTNRATPVDLRAGVRVVEVDGLLLEVEPLAGGAVDYRDKRRGTDEADGTAEDDEPPAAVPLLVDGRPIDEP